MYRLKSGVKQNPARRWALPDRIFFGRGACHILAGAYLSRPPLPGFYAEKITPADGFAGNHIYVTDGVISFDYRGYASRLRLLRHHTRWWADQYDEGWSCALTQVDFDLLSTPDLNQRKMLGPDQYLHDPVRRAHRFLDSADHRIAPARALAKCRLGGGV